MGNSPKENPQTGKDNRLCTFVLPKSRRYNRHRFSGMSEVIAVSDAFRFETFVDVHSNIFSEYLSSVVAKLSKRNEKYQALQDEIESLYEKYPAVLGVCDSEQAAELTKEECIAVIKVTELKNRLTDMELQSVYFRGCYDSVGYLKKAGIL